MKDITITASYGRTMQFKQFEPSKFHASATATLESTDNMKEEYPKLWNAIKSEVDRQIKERVDIIKES